MADDPAARLEAKLTTLLGQCEDDERALLLEILEAAADPEVEGFDISTGQATGKRQHQPFGFRQPELAASVLTGVLSRHGVAVPPPSDLGS